MLRLGRRVGFSFGGLGRGGGDVVGGGWWVVGGLERLIHLGVEVESSSSLFRCYGGFHYAIGAK